jgi:hypothetical protein
MVWSYAAILVGVLVVAFGFLHRASRRVNQRLINVGNLSESWLAEQRAQRNESDPTDNH